VDDWRAVLDGSRSWAVECGDCLEVLPLLPDDSVQLVYADAPYNAGMDYGEGFDDSRPWPEWVEWMDRVVTECERVSSGLVLLSLSVTAMLHMVARRRPLWVCVWNKPMSFSHRAGGSPWLPHWEPTLVYGRRHGDGGRVPPWALSDVWSFNTATRNGHPCPKPIPLLRHLARHIPFDVVLDPFGGSGTTAIAALAEGKRAILIERSADYCEIARARIEPKGTML